jgi:DNA invertase Pin-like site-specific DNA recombinase
MRAAVYARRSTDEHQAASLEVQTAEARRFIEARGWQFAEALVYEDDAISRAEFKKRPALLAMLNAARDRRFDILVTRDETRLGGEMIRTALLVQDLLDAGIRLFYYFTGEEVRLDDATAKFMMAAKNFAAELEREKVSQRTHEHLLTKARRGLNVGGRCYGYDNVEVFEGDRRIRVEYAINDAEAQIVSEIFQRYAHGDGLRAIVKQLNARRVPSPRSGTRGTGSWSTAAIHEMLRRSRYRGQIERNRQEKTYRGGTKVRLEREDDEVVRVEAEHLRIVDESLWNSVQARVLEAKRAARGKGGRPTRYLLSGICRCSECGGPLTVINHRLGTAIVKVYVCSYHRSRGDEVCKNTARRPVDAVNRVLVDWMRGNVLTEELVAEVVSGVQLRLDELTRGKSSTGPTLEEEAGKLRDEIARLVEAVATAGQSLALIQALSERESGLADVEARIRARRAAPDAMRIELKRLEVGARKRVVELQCALERNPDEARAVVSALLDGGHLTATPIETENGRRFLLEGTAVVGNLLACEPVSNSASPTGFESAFN